MATIRTGRALRSYLRDLATRGVNVGVGLCMKNVRTAYGIPALGDYDGDGDADAVDGWKAARLRHKVEAVDAVPAGVPVWWTGGSHGYGHVAISDGGGWAWSTDLRRPGRWDRVRISQVAQTWGGMTLAGWSEDLNGVTVWTKPTPPPSRGEHVDAAAAELRAAAKASAGAPARLAKIRATLAALRKIGRVR